MINFTEKQAFAAAEACFFRASRRLFFAASPSHAHTALRARSLFSADAISLPRRKEMAKEKTPKRSPWEPPGIAALQRATREITYAFLVLSLKFSHHERQAGKAKGFCQDKPILGVRSCAQDGGGLRKQKPRRLSKSRRAAGFQGALSPLVPFLSPFLCGTTKKWHLRRYSAARSSTESRWAVCAWKGEAV